MSNPDGLGKDYWEYRGQIDIGNQTQKEIEIQIDRLLKAHPLWKEIFCFPHNFFRKFYIFVR